MAKMNFQLVFLILVGCSIQSVHLQTLRSLAEAHNRYIGVALNAEVFHDADYVAVLDREIDMITPENAMKWKMVERNRSVFTYGEADEIVAHALAHKQRVRGHCLVWHEEVPDWVENGNFSATQLRDIMKHRIQGEVTRYKGKIYAWDVLNEVINENGSMRETIWYKTLGKGFIADAFKFAHEADPEAKLYINDYNVEGVNAKSDALYAIVKELKAANVPVHATGFQAHFSLGQLPTDIVKNLERFAALDVEVAITELDVAITMPVSAAKLEQQAKDYKAVVEACLAVPKCVGITMWGMSDKYSWIPYFSQHARGAGLPFDEHFKEKPAYTAMKLALSKK